MTAAPPGLATVSAVTLVAAGPGYAVAAAPAKVNLFLEVVGRRADGYHDIETLLLPVDLFDTVEVRGVPGHDFTLECDPPGLPTGPTNLVSKAADAIKGLTGRRFGARIRLVKRIPHEAGLGGGSSDAAATLVALNHLFFHSDLTPEHLFILGGDIGSDVPAFLVGPAAWATGRGEVVDPAPVGGVLHLVLVKPPFGLGTASVYGHVSVPADPVEGSALRAAVAAGDAVRIAPLMHNRLQEAAFAAGPAVAALHARLAACGPLAAMVSGSGSCVFALCRGRADAVRVAGLMAGAGRVFVVRAGSGAGSAGN